MDRSKQTGLLVGDLGNTSVHLGLFPAVAQQTQLSDVGYLPEPEWSFSCLWSDLPWDVLADKLSEFESMDYQWRLGSVNRTEFQRMASWIDARGESRQSVTYSDFSMPMCVREPHRVGIDRIAAAYAANRLRAPHQAAIVVDSGTAITIDCVTPAGQFVGGAIGCGVQLSLQALSSGTDQLPEVALDAVPPLIGDHTTQAIRAGIYWMTVNGLNGYLQALKQELAAPCLILGTGGSLPLFLPQLQHEVQYHPNLVLSGLALTQP